jgi:hypothetical protein
MVYALCVPGKLTAEWTPAPAPGELLFGHLQQALARYESGTFHNHPGLLIDSECCKAQYLFYTGRRGQGKGTESTTTGVQDRPENWQCESFLLPAPSRTGYQVSCNSRSGLDFLPSVPSQCSEETHTITTQQLSQALIS